MCKMSIEVWNVADYLASGRQWAIYEEDRERARKWVATAVEKHGDTFDKIILLVDGTGYDKVYGIVGEKQFLLREFGDYMEALLFSEQFVDNGNISNKNIEVVKDTDPKVLGFYWD